jgi:hypothetical protein
MAKKPVKQIASAEEPPKPLVSVSSSSSRARVVVVQDPVNENSVQLSISDAVKQRFLAATQTTNWRASQELLAQVGRIVSRFSWITASEGLVAALELVEDLAPQGAAQSLLVMQMLSVHFAALSSLIKAALPDIDMAVAELYTNRATRLMRLYAQQSELLARLQGKITTQKVVVERIDIASGSQAVVGIVEAAKERGAGTR